MFQDEELPNFLRTKSRVRCPSAKKETLDKFSKEVQSKLKNALIFDLMLFTPAAKDIFTACQIKNAMALERRNLISDFDRDQCYRFMYGSKYIWKEKMCYQFTALKLPVKSVLYDPIIRSITLKEDMFQDVQEFHLFYSDAEENLLKTSEE